MLYCKCLWVFVTTFSYFGHNNSLGRIMTPVLIIQNKHVIQLLHIIIITLLIEILFPSVVYYDQVLVACHTLISYHNNKMGYLIILDWFHMETHHFRVITLFYLQCLELYWNVQTLNDKEIAGGDTYYVLGLRVCSCVCVCVCVCVTWVEFIWRHIENTEITNKILNLARIVLPILIESW